jgi:C4-dicarboxylate-specific signal transduction histidine kinase
MDVRGGSLVQLGETTKGASDAGRRPQASPGGQRTIALAFLRVIVIWLAAVGLIWASYRDDIEDWKKTAQNTSLATTAYTRQSLAAAELVLKSMADWISDEGIDSDEQLRHVMSERRFSDALRDRIVAAPQISVALIASRNGDVVNSSERPNPAAPASIADREAFRTQIADNAPPLSLTRLARNPLTARWTFYISRHVIAKSGSLLGVIVIGLDSQYFSDLFRQMSADGNASVSLFRTDGTLLATTIADRVLLGRGFPDAAAIRLIEQGRSGSVQIVSGPRWSDPTKQGSRIAAPRLVEGYPLLVGVSIGSDAYLGDWWQKSAVIVVIGLVLTILVVHMASRFLDLLGRSEMAHRLTAERRLFAALVDTPSALCAIVDRQGKLVYCNERFGSMIAPGGDPAAALSDRALYGADAVLSFAAGGSDHAMELDLQLERSGEASRLLHFSLSRQSLPDYGDCTIMVGHDETARHEVRLALMQSAKMVTLGEMTTGMAHELSQPLNVIRMAAQNVLTEVGSSEGGSAEALEPSQMTDAEFRGFAAGKLRRIVAQVDRAADILSRMRIFGRAPMEPPSTFDARAACRSAIALVGSRIRTMGISIVEDLGPDPLPLLAFQNLLEQVVINLLLNARDALRDSTQPDKRIEVSARRHGDRILVRVADNGPGVPPNIRDRIFEPFYTAKPLGQGTGLGLALSFGIIRDAGGTLSLLASTGGAVFQIELPAVVPVAAA